MAYKILILLLITSLTGCVYYKNDRGQDCRAEVDPITAIASVPFMLVNPENGYPATICKKYKDTQ